MAQRNMNPLFKASENVDDQSDAPSHTDYYTRNNPKHGRGYTGSRNRAGPSKAGANGEGGSERNRKKEETKHKNWRYARPDAAKSFIESTGIALRLQQDQKRSTIEFLEKEIQNLIQSKLALHLGRNIDDISDFAPNCRKTIHLRGFNWVGKLEYDAKICECCSQQFDVKAWEVACVPSSPVDSHDWVLRDVMELQRMLQLRYGVSDNGKFKCRLPSPCFDQPSANLFSPLLPLCSNRSSFRLP